MGGGGASRRSLLDGFCAFALEGKYDSKEINSLKTAVLREVFEFSECASFSTQTRQSVKVLITQTDLFFI